jgi:hypothetical protein
MRKIYTSYIYPKECPLRECQSAYVVFVEKFEADSVLNATYERLGERLEFRHSKSDRLISLVVPKKLFSKQSKSIGKLMNSRIVVEYESVSRERDEKLSSLINI